MAGRTIGYHKKQSKSVGIEGAFNYDTAEPIYTLDFKMPNDFDEKSGFHNFSKAEQNVQFSGLYKCYRVISTFNEVFKTIIQRIIFV